MNKPIDLDVKRFYLPGVYFGESCPECKTPKTVDFGAEYLSYPTANVEFDYEMSCGECHYEWKIRLRLDVVLRRVVQEKFHPNEGVEEDLT